MSVFIVPGLGPTGYESLVPLTANTDWKSYAALVWGLLSSA
jgi:hypothetical protein